MKFSCIKLIQIVLVSCFLAGCQTQVSKSSSPLSQSLENFEPVALDVWLANSPIPSAQDVPMDAGEVASARRKVGFDPAPPEISPWIGKTRSELISFC